MNNSGVNAVALPAWLIAIAGAWMLSAEAGCAATLGYVVQWSLKAPAKVKDWAAPAITIVAAFLLYAFVLKQAPPDWHITREWFASFATWALSALGIASAAGRTGGAAKTNSL